MTARVAQVGVDQFQGIDQSLLTGLVRQVTRRDAVELLEWRCHHIQGTHNSVATGGVYRVSGAADDRGERLSWSMVLKLVRAPIGGDSPADWNYWRREVLAYQSGMLEHLPGGLAAPRLLAVAEYPGEAAGLWLEDLDDDYGPDWPLSSYGAAARCLGRFNGAYLAGQPIPD